MTKKTTEYRYVGQVPDELTGGHPLSTDVPVRLTDTEQADPHNARLIATGALIPTKERDAT